MAIQISVSTSISANFWFFLWHPSRVALRVNDHTAGAHVLFVFLGAQRRVSELGSSHPSLGDQNHKNEWKWPGPSSNPRHADPDPDLAALVSALVLAWNTIVPWLLGFCVHRKAFSSTSSTRRGWFPVPHLPDCNFLEALLTSFHSVSSSIANCFTTVLTFAYLEGLTLLSTISPERCLSILDPIWYHCGCPRHTSALKCAGPGPCVSCWIFWKRTIMASF